MRRPLVPLLALVCAAAAPRAQDDPAFLRAAFARLDGDGDGKVTRAEFPGSDRQFAAMDRDEDGAATFAEYERSDVARALVRERYRDKEDARPRTAPAQLAAQRLLLLSRADPNRDGKVTRDEWTGTEVAFLQLDLDGNGVLDKRDRAVADAQTAPPPPPLPEPKGALPDAADLLRRFDRDRDGRLGPKELKDKWLQDALRLADGDGDGALNEDELRRLLARIQALRNQRDADGRRPQPYAVPFDAWDKDDDDKLLQAEWQGPVFLFQALDLDRDAAVSRDEVLRYERRVLGNDFVERFDLDGNGKVTPEEFAGPRGAFQRADTNGDGVVSRADR
ncbi:MAG: EF-hand domain-containing protein [Planctomycetota bacterium]